MKNKKSSRPAWFQNAVEHWLNNAMQYSVKHLKSINQSARLRSFVYTHFEYWPIAMRQEFSDWLFAQGLLLKQENKEFKITWVSDPSILTMFILKFS